MSRVRACDCVCVSVFEYICESCEVEEAKRSTKWENVCFAFNAVCRRQVELKAIQQHHHRSNMQCHIYRYTCAECYTQYRIHIRGPVVKTLWVRASLGDLIFLLFVVVVVVASSSFSSSLLHHTIIVSHFCICFDLYQRNLFLLWFFNFGRGFFLFHSFFETLSTKKHDENCSIPVIVRPANTIQNVEKTLQEVRQATLRAKRNYSYWFRHKT